MSGLPPSLSIALWFTGSMWVVAILAHIGDAPREIVYASFSFGAFVFAHDLSENRFTLFRIMRAGIVEYQAYRRSKH